jgi:hypothetical protein
MGIKKIGIRAISYKLPKKLYKRIKIIAIVKETQNQLYIKDILEKQIKDFNYIEDKMSSYDKKDCQEVVNKVDFPLWKDLKIKAAGLGISMGCLISNIILKYFEKK